MHDLYHMVYTMVEWYMPSKSDIYHEATFQMSRYSDSQTPGPSRRPSGLGDSSRCTGAAAAAAAIHQQYTLSLRQ
jgi:hypothetical protein